MTSSNSPCVEEAFRSDREEVDLLAETRKSLKSAGDGGSPTRATAARQSRQKQIEKAEQDEFKKDERRLNKNDNKKAALFSQEDLLRWSAFV